MIILTLVLFPFRAFAIHEELEEIQKGLEKLVEQMKILKTASAEMPEEDLSIVTFSSLPLALQKIGLCESNGKQSARGKLGEIGMFQIMLFHIPAARKLGLNIYEPEDNMKFALYLFEKNGLKDWRNCQKKLAARPVK